MTRRLPWKVAYKPNFDEWDRFSCPMVVDADGGFIVRPPQTPGINHPGEYDKEADDICHQIVNAVNGIGPLLETCKDVASGPGINWLAGQLKLAGAINVAEGLPRGYTGEEE